MCEAVKRTVGLIKNELVKKHVESESVQSADSVCIELKRRVDRESRNMCAAFKEYFMIHDKPDIILTKQDTQKTMHENFIHYASHLASTFERGIDLKPMLPYEAATHTLSATSVRRFSEYFASIYRSATLEPLIILIFVCHLIFIHQRTITFTEQDNDYDGDYDEGSEEGEEYEEVRQRTMAILLRQIGSPRQTFQASSLPLPIFNFVTDMKIETTLAPLVVMGHRLLCDNAIHAVIWNKMLPALCRGQIMASEIPCVFEESAKSRKNMGLATTQHVRLHSALVSTSDKTLLVFIVRLFFPSEFTMQREKVVMNIVKKATYR
ncbi:hypothetical protein T265_05069 [Opisthorchis viverrini]|uniref:Uncharacterized protein n=1 Tax=Opisthorchis viverrini TaxID=6198 RepID=A0A074ZKZ4_OPIVI|nr:hypothetical protein T265_05069 [Opisthorchis viverrini]KER28023.1 hypothetical protein T265_05069 [Opisthorchis viverrini]